MPPSASPPTVVSLERAWRDLMQTLVIRNPGKVNSANITRRVIRSQTRGR